MAQKMKRYQKWIIITWLLMIALAVVNQFVAGNETAAAVYLSTALVVLAIGIATHHIEAVIRETETEK